MSIHKKPEKIVDLLLDRLKKMVDAIQSGPDEVERKNNLLQELNSIQNEIRNIHNFSSRIRFRSLEESLSKLKEFIELGESVASIDVQKDGQVSGKRLDYSVLDVVKKNIVKLKKSQELPKQVYDTWNVSSSSQQQVNSMPRGRSQLEIPEKLIKSFQASYGSLKDFRLKLCFLCFSIFPEKCVIKKRPMIHWWMAEGLVASDDEGDRVFWDLMDKGLIKPPKPRKEEDKSPIKNSCTLRPWIRRMLLSMAKQVKFFHVYDNDDSEEDKQRRIIYLLEKSSHDHNNNNIIKSQESVDEVFNLDQEKLSFDANWLSNLKKVKVLQLGRWQVSPKHHIEIEKEECLDGLKSQKKLKYLSLRGISRITKLPHSITELITLKILDLRACHNLENLPSDVSMLKNLTHLDISECYLLESMPKGLDRLSNLLVLKGFVIGSKTKNIGSKLSDLTQLPKLYKLSVYIRANSTISEEEFEKLGEFKSLRKLTTSWGKNASKFPSSICFPQELQKLDLRCIPEETTPKWLDPRKLLNLEKLYIRGGALTDFCNAESKEWIWRVKILRLRHLKKFKISNSQDLKKMFPDAVYLEKSRCSDGQDDIFWYKDVND